MPQMSSQPVRTAISGQHCELQEGTLRNIRYDLTTARNTWTSTGNRGFFFLQLCWSSSQQFDRSPCRLVSVSSTCSIEALVLLPLIVDLHGSQASRDVRGAASSFRHSDSHLSLPYPPPQISSLIPKSTHLLLSAHH